MRMATRGDSGGSGIAPLVLENTPYVRAATLHASALVTMVTQGTDPHCETEIREVWNEENQANEVHEFDYEISWIPEILAWRRFLRTHRMVSNRESQLYTLRS